MSKPTEDAKTVQIRRDVDEVTAIMSDNVNKQIDNLSKTEDLERQIQDLEHHSFVFKKRSKQVRCQMIWENWKIGLLIAAFVGLAILIVVIALS